MGPGPPGAARVALPHASAPRAATTVALVAVVLLGLLVGPAGAARSQAQPRITYTFVGTTFGDGGTLTGSFVFDPNLPCRIPTCHTNGAISGLSITTSGGGGDLANPLTYTTSDLTNATSATQLWFASSLLMALAFTSPLGSPGRDRRRRAGAPAPQECAAGRSRDRQG